MRQELHEIIENVGDLRLVLKLTHHIATDHDEAHQLMGWEITELSFILRPDTSEEDGGPKTLTLTQSTTKMEWIRNWIAGFNLTSLLHMLCGIIPGLIREYEHQRAFNQALVEIDAQLAKLDEEPTWPFAD